MMIFMRRRMVVMSDDDVDDGAPTLNRISLVIASVNDVILQLLISHSNNVDDCRIHGSVCAAGEVRALEETTGEAAAGSE